MNLRALKIFLPVLLFFSFGYYIYHPGEDLTLPEVYWPAEDGERPGPGNDMVPPVVLVDKKLGGWNAGAVKSSTMTWSSVSGSTARLEYGGTVTLIGDFTRRLNVPDGKNTVEVVPSGWFFGPSLVALTVLQYETDTGKVSEADIFLNGQDYKWGDIALQRDVSADVQNIVTHELGHFLGLGHSQYRLATMSRTTRPSETRRRNLSIDDEDALYYLYPGTEAGLFPAPPSLWHLAKGGCEVNWAYLYGPAIADANTSQTGFCLYGAGFSPGTFEIDLISQKTGQKFNPVTSAVFLTENLLMLDIDLSQLGIDSYAMFLKNNDQVASLPQALLVKRGGATLPAAKIAPISASVQFGQVVTLDGSSSTSYSGGALSYHWFVAESSAVLQLGDTTGPAIGINPEHPGDYVIGLMVDDGENYSTISKSLVSFFEPANTPETADGSCGCRIAGASPGPGLALELAPLLFLVLLRIRKMLGRGMRQAGILAAAGIWALERNLKRLAEDHKRARDPACALSELPGIEIGLSKVQTNIINLPCDPEGHGCRFFGQGPEKKGRARAFGGKGCHPRGHASGCGRPWH